MGEKIIVVCSVLLLIFYSTRLFVYKGNKNGFFRLSRLVSLFSFGFYKQGRRAKKRVSLCQGTSDGEDEEEEAEEAEEPTECDDPAASAATTLSLNSS